MSDAGASTDQELVPRARAGDAAAFDKLMVTHRGKLRGVIRRLVGHPEDTDDLVQESMIRAWQGMAEFRGEATFATWLCAIGIRQALDHLRRDKPWRSEAQIVYANACAQTESLRNEVISIVAQPEFVYEAREHIAYCFQCVGRALPPERHAALVLREVLGLSNREAAETLGLSESVLRHHLSAARQSMTQQFEGLCSLVNKNGVCYQCEGLRAATPPSRQGPPVPNVAGWEDRIAVVRQADIDHGLSQAMHDLFWRRTKALEDCGAGSTQVESDCGRT